VGGLQDDIIQTGAAPGPQMGVGVEEFNDVLSEAIRVDTNAENVTKISLPWTVTASSVGTSRPYSLPTKNSVAGIFTHLGNP
jgi:hypothetical protein